MKVDPKRRDRHGTTGIYARAQDTDGKWITADIAELDSASLLRFLRIGGEVSRWAEDVVGILLDHGHLNDDPERNGTRT